MHILWNPSCNIITLQTMLADSLLIVSQEQIFGMEFSQLKSIHEVDCYSRITGVLASPQFCGKITWVQTIVENGVNSKFQSVMYGKSRQALEAGHHQNAEDPACLFPCSLVAFSPLIDPFSREWWCPKRAGSSYIN